jgi:hypothetical protein
VKYTTREKPKADLTEIEISGPLGGEDVNYDLLGSDV